METLRLRPATMHVHELTEQQSTFARLVVQLGNQAAAYRQAYNVGPNTLPATVWQEASRLANTAKVCERIQQLRDEAAAQTTINVAARMQWLHDIETADPSEIVAVVLRNCRHCRGAHHRFQWKNDHEYACACDKAIRDGQQHFPDISGGFGFNAALEPVSSCTECNGDGVRVAMIADTTKLTGKARKLYKGIRVRADGSLDILLHDQLAARDQLNRMLGCYKDVQLQISKQPTARSASAPCTAEEAMQTYLRMIHGVE